MTVIHTPIHQYISELFMLCRMQTIQTVETPFPILQEIIHSSPFIPPSKERRKSSITFLLRKQKHLKQLSAESVTMGPAEHSRMARSSSCPGYESMTREVTCAQETKLESEARQSPCVSSAEASPEHLCTSEGLAGGEKDSSEVQQSQTEPEKVHLQCSMGNQKTKCLLDPGSTDKITKSKSSKTPILPNNGTWKKVSRSVPSKDNQELNDGKKIISDAHKGSSSIKTLSKSQQKSSEFNFKRSGSDSEICSFYSASEIQEMAIELELENKMFKDQKQTIEELRKTGCQHLHTPQCQEEAPDIKTVVASKSTKKPTSNLSNEGENLRSASYLEINSNSISSTDDPDGCINKDSLAPHTKTVSNQDDLVSFSISKSISIIQDTSGTDHKTSSAGSTSFESVEKHLDHGYSYSTPTEEFPHSILTHSLNCNSIKRPTDLRIDSGLRVKQVTFMPQKSVSTLDLSREEYEPDRRTSNCSGLTQSLSDLVQTTKTHRTSITGVKFYPTIQPSYVKTTTRQLSTPTYSPNLTGRRLSQQICSNQGALRAEQWRTSRQRSCSIAVPVGLHENWRGTIDRHDELGESNIPSLPCSFQGTPGAIQHAFLGMIFLPFRYVNLLLLLFLRYGILLVWNLGQSYYRALLT